MPRKGKEKPARHEHERGAPLTKDCDNWCKAKYDKYKEHQKAWNTRASEAGK